MAVVQQVQYTKNVAFNQGAKERGMVRPDVETQNSPEVGFLTPTTETKLPHLAVWILRKFVNEQQDLLIHQVLLAPTHNLVRLMILATSGE